MILATNPSLWNFEISHYLLLFTITSPFLDRFTGGDDVLANQMYLKKKKQSTYKYMLNELFLISEILSFWFNVEKANFLNEFEHFKDLNNKNSWNNNLDRFNYFILQ